MRLIDKQCSGDASVRLALVRGGRRPAERIMSGLPSHYIQTRPRPGLRPGAMVRSENEMRGFGERRPLVGRAPRFTAAYVSIGLQPAPRW